MENQFARKQAPTPEPPAAPNMLGKGTGLNGSDIVELGVSQAACLATNRIMVDGAPIKFARRDPDRLGPQDSGWWFFAGDEDDVYKDEVSNLGVYAINTVANDNQVIVPILDEAPAPPGSASATPSSQTPKASRRRATESQNDNRYYPYLLKPEGPRLNGRTYLPVEALPVEMNGLTVGWLW